MAAVTERITATSPGQSTAGSTLSKTVAQSHVAGVVSSVTFTPAGRIEVEITRTA